MNIQIPAEILFNKILGTPIRVDSLVQYSDAHNDPDSFREKAVLLYGKGIGATLVDASDGPDMLIYGRDAFGEWKNKVLEALDGYDIYMVDSNHTPMPWLKKLFIDCPNVHIARFWEFELPSGLVVHVRHGHEYFIDWFLLRWIAPGLCHFMTDHFPKQWHWFATKMGWMPTAPAGEGRYHIVVQNIWRRMVQLALGRSQELGKIVVVISAHTHAIGKLEGAFRGFPADHGDLRVLHADSGTVAIGSYCEVINNVELKRI